MCSDAHIETPRSRCAKTGLCCHDLPYARTCASSGVHSPSSTRHDSPGSSLSRFSATLSRSPSAPPTMLYSVPSTRACDSTYGQWDDRWEAEGEMRSVGHATRASTAATKVRCACPRRSIQQYHTDLCGRVHQLWLHEHIGRLHCTRVGQHHRHPRLHVRPHTLRGLHLELCGAGRGTVGGVRLVRKWFVAH